MDPQRMIEQSAAVNAASVAINEVTKVFRSSLETQVAVRVKLDRRQQSIVERETGAYVRFLQENVITNDHPVIYAFREIARSVYARLAKPKQTKFKSLCVGVGWREVTSYWDNPCVFFHHAGVEAKDTSRFAIQCLEHVLNSKVKGSKRLNGKEVAVNITMTNIDAMINTLNSTGILPDRFVNLDLNSGTQEFHQLLLEDVGYNFSDPDWIRLFEKTNAVQAIGYMALPYELVFDNVMPSDYYRYMEQGDCAIMSYDYASGYKHEKKAWATLLKKTVIIGPKFSLAVELHARIGVMTVFQITRIQNSARDTPVRTLSLPEHLRCVGVLDLGSITSVGGKVNKLVSSYRYIKMRKSEIDDLVNYILSLDEKSHKLQNVVLYLRRRVSGVSLVTSELVNKWQVKDADIPAVALCALIYTQYKLVLFGNIQDNLGVGSWVANIMASIRGVANKIFEPLFNALGNLCERQLIDRLIVGHDDVLFQQCNYSHFKSVDLDYKVILDVSDKSDGTDDENVPCALCSEMRDLLGKQIVVCKEGGEFHNFSLDDGEVKIFRANLQNVEHDPQGIKEVKTKALASCPISGFSTGDVKLHYIRGGPGTGKSRLIKALASPDDLIVGPFAKLQADYSGGNVKLFTPHIAMTKVNHKRVFIDEFTALSYEFMAIIAKNVNAEEMFLVGDIGQTGIIEGVEGINAATKISFSDVRTHVLQKDFRNPLDAVHLLNDMFDYELEPVSKSLGFRFRHLDLWNNSVGEVPLCFTYNSAVSLGLDSEIANKITVRANQGQTFDNTAVFLTSHDANLLRISAMSVVAFSRHKKFCTIYHDNSPDISGHVAKLKSIVYPKILALAPYPERNTCLIEAFSEILNSIPSVRITNEDIWCTLVTLIGVDDSRAISGSMLTTDHLKILCEDFGVSVELIFSRQRGVLNRPKIFGTGPLLGQIAWGQNHFKAVGAADFVPRVPSYNLGSTPNNTCADGHFVNVHRKACDPEAIYATPFTMSGYVYGLYGDNARTGHLTGLPIPKNIHEVCRRWDEKYRAIVEVFGSLKKHDFSIKAKTGTTLVFGRFNGKILACGDRLFQMSSADMLELRGCSELKFSVCTNYEKVVVVHIADTLPLIGGAIDEMSEGFREHVKIFDGPEDMTMIAKNPVYDDRDEIVPIEQFGNDSYRHLPAMFDIHYGSVSQFTNEVASEHINSHFRTGILAGNFMWRIGLRGKPKVAKVSGYSMMENAPGLYYFKKNPYQELQCLQSRYLGNKLAADCDIHGYGIAYEIADLFVNEHMDVVQFPSMDEINSTLKDSYSAMVSKKYHKIVDPTTLGFDCNVVNFHMKDIIKPFKSSVDLGKAGQGISAWSKDTQSLFQNACRVINLCFKKMLRAHVIYDNLESTDEIFVKANELLSSLPKVCSNGVIDATACDSGQNEFTQAIERRILQRMGVSEIFLGWYYRFRKSYVLRASDVSGNITGIKTSGEPATLLCNTILMMALMNGLLRGEGPCVLLGKGDDGLKRQANLKYNKELVSRFSRYTVLDFKVEINQPVNFCGNALVGDKLYPCIMRKAFKVTGHCFKDYLHFKEYQQSLRDWILQINKLGMMNTVACTAEFCGFTMNEVYLIFGMLVSLSHINAQQFYETFVKIDRNFDDKVPEQAIPAKANLNFDAFRK